MYQSYLKLDQLFLKNIIIALVLIILNKSLSYIDYANGQSVTQMYLLVVILVQSLIYLLRGSYNNRLNLINQQP